MKKVYPQFNILKKKVSKILNTKMMKVVLHLKHPIIKKALLFKQKLMILFKIY
jgi:hypothetical protein